MDAESRTRMVFRRSVLVTLALAIAAAIVFGARARWTRRARPAEGRYTAEYVGLSIEFPSGWAHLPAEDATKTVGGGVQLVDTPMGRRPFPVAPTVLKWSRFYRGGSRHSPDRSLTILAGPTVGDLASDRIADDSGLRARAEKYTRAALADGYGWESGGCEALALAARRVGRCHARILKGGAEAFWTSYLLLLPERAVVAIFESTRQEEDEVPESDTIAASIESGP